tara:strand:- start:892 stop:1923 length:1032 start_codon:yes stop_codon:yes gene_type:complete
MWNNLLKIGSKAVNELKWGAKQLDKKRDEIFGTAGENDWEQQLPKKLQQLADKTPVGIAENQAVEVAETVAEKLGINPQLAGLVVGTIMPGPGAGKLKPRKVRSVKPDTAVKMAARDQLVRTNTPPKRSDFRPADFRGISGDIQGGLEGKPLRMETRPEYKQVQTGVSNPTGKDPKNFTPHHRMGIQDQQALTANLTPEQLKIRRSQLDEGGLYMGNRGENYTGLYDGKKSAKAGEKTGIYSTDHFDVHALSDEMRKKLGIKMDRKDRTLDTFNGKPIKDMPDGQQFAIQAQLGFRDELIIDKVQSARYKALMDKFGHLSPAERRKLILNNPKAFANLSTKVQ